MVRRSIVRRLAVHFLLVVLLFTGVALAAHGVHAAPADYVGQAACATCHPAAQKAWEASAHARAASPEVLGRHARDAACLTCHATGEGARTLLPGVQCEACHGAGAGYASAADVMRDRPLARALGLRDLSRDPAAACARCHSGSGTRAARFDPTTAWKKIAH
jgi:hypothetical protein